MARSGTHYHDIVREEEDDLPRVSSGSGSRTVNQPTASAPPRRRGRRGDPDEEEDLPPPAPNEALIERIHMILATPGRVADRLDPEHAPGTFWFGFEPIIARRISDTIKSYFPRGYYNWRDATDPSIRDQWFELWTKQYWTWDPVHTYRIRREFERKGSKRLVDTVHRWKNDWLAMGDRAMPYGMDPAAWRELVTYWQSVKGKKHSESATKARNTPVAPGDVSNRHRLGQTPMAGLRLKMAAESESGELPPVIDVYERAYRKADGTYLTKTAEKVRTDYELAVSQTLMERDSQPETANIPMTLEDYDNIYKKVAPKKKGRILGLGSIAAVPASSSSSTQRDAAARQAAVEAELADLRQFKLDSTAREQGLVNVLKAFAGDNPAFHEAIRANYPSTVVPEAEPTEEEVEERAAAIRREHGYPPVDLANRDHI